MHFHLIDSDVNVMYRNNICRQIQLMINFSFREKKSLDIPLMLLVSAELLVSAS